MSAETDRALAGEHHDAAVSESGRSEDRLVDAVLSVANALLAIEARLEEIQGVLSDA